METPLFHVIPDARVILRAKEVQTVIKYLEATNNPKQ